MLDTLRRLFTEPRPIDWAMLVIELLVLALIAIEVIPEQINKGKLRKREAVLANLVAVAYSLQQSVPMPTHEQTVKDDWTKAVHRWEFDTGQYLKNSCSVLAYGAFHQDLMMQLPIPTTVADPHAYRLLMERMENLRRIVESPEAYLG